MTIVGLALSLNIVGSATVFPQIIVIEPGGTVPFRADPRKDEVPADGWDSVETQLTGTWGTQFTQDRWASRPLVLERFEEVERTEDSLVVEGEIRNSGDVPLSPFVAVAIYTSDGRFRGSMISFDVNDVAVPPGRTVRFTIRSDYQPHENLWYAGSDYTYEIVVL